MSSANLRLELIQNGKSMGSFLMEKNCVTIGSSHNADYIVPGQKVSGIHAMIRQQAGQTTLYDLGSKFGTFVKEKRIIETALSNGSIFKLGDRQFRLITTSAIEEQSTPEKTLFYNKQPGSPEILDIVCLEKQKITALYFLLPGEKLKAGCKEKQIFFPEHFHKKEAFVRRKNIKGQEIAICYLPNNFVAEVYNANNELVKKIEATEGLFTIQTTEKVRIFNQEKEFQIYWRKAYQRVSRKIIDVEQKDIQKSLAGSLSLSLLLAGAIYLLQKQKKDEELDMEKQSYVRVTTDIRQADAPPAAAAAAPAEQNQQQATPAPTKTQNIVSNMLNKLLRHDTVASITQEVGKKVVNTAAVETNSSQIQKTDVQTSTNTSVNASALIAGGGKGTGKNFVGFKGQAGNVLGNGAGQGPGIEFGGDEAETVGGLDKSQIAAVVQANLGQIRQCYERQLLIDANLYGKIVAKWTINGEGRVTITSIASTTMKSPPVENCVMQKIRGWVFPKPRGGGNVIVSYPFLFKTIH